MANFMKYKNYEGSIEFSPEDHVLFGKVQFIRPLLSYSGDSLTELETQFHEVVDEYLADCRIDGVQPEKPCSGSFNIRIGQDLHHKIAVYAAQRSESINAVIEKVLAERFDKQTAA